MDMCTDLGMYAGYKHPDNGIIFPKIFVFGPISSVFTYCKVIYCSVGMTWMNRGRDVLIVSCEGGCLVSSPFKGPLT